MDYGFTHQGRVYTPNGTPDISPADNEARNKAIEAAELAAWQAQPDRWLAYYAFPAEQNRQNKTYRESFYPLMTGAKVTTWQGQPLGTIVSARVYRHNFGSRMVAITVQGNNGAVYHGRASYDNGECVNLRKAKG